MAMATARESIRAWPTSPADGRRCDTPTAAMAGIGTGHRVRAIPSYVGGSSSVLVNSGQNAAPAFRHAISRSVRLSALDDRIPKYLPRELGIDGGRRNIPHVHRKRQAPMRRGPSTTLACRCLGEGAWFEFPSESSSKNGGTVRVGDFKILSHLQELGCGSLKGKPEEVYFGGCINESYAFHCTGGSYFVKINRRFDVDSMFAGELEALKRMNATKTIRVPAPLGCGSLSDGGSYLIMEHLHFRPFGMLKSSSQEALGRNLARLHLADVGESFGFPLQTRLGVLPLSNDWNTSWRDFFIDKRLRERLMRAYTVFEAYNTDIRKKGDLVLERGRAILKDHHHVRPSLLHGDLWMGNAGLTSAGEVAIFDPACFIGDAEFDLAFQEWSPSRGFPGLTEEFYSSYHELLPRTSGFEERHRLYQLYHLLNHLLLYQMEYFQHVMVTMDRILMN